MSPAAYWLTVASLIGATVHGLSQVMTPLCTPVESDHTCLDIPARNTTFTYPHQVLPGNNMLISGNIITSFSFLQDPNPLCLDLFRAVICFYPCPPCSEESNLLLPVCPESCSAFNRFFQEKRCDVEIEVIEKGLLNTNAEPLIVALQVSTYFDCRNVSTYYLQDNESFLHPEECTDLLTPQQTADIISAPNRCEPTPPLSICSSTFVSQYTHYIPLRSRNITSSQPMVSISYQELLEEIVASGNISENCTSTILSLGCYITYPPCDPETGDAIPLCTENCDAEFSLIQSCVDEVPVNNNLLADMMAMFNCSDVNSYLPDFVRVNSLQCVDLEQFESVPGEVLAVSVIAGSIVGAAVFLILVIVLIVTALVILYMRRSSHRKQNGIRRMYHKESVSPHYNAGGYEVAYTDEEYQLNDADRRSYEKVFSSIIVPYTALTIGEEIGQGAFGTVFRGEMKKSDSKFEDIAIKTIKNLSSSNEVESFFAEILLMMEFSHTNILGLAGVCFDTADGVPYILLPFMANGSLKEFLKSKRVHVTNVETLPEDLTESKLVCMCLDVARGMEYLAENKFVHRDLAARNCLLDSELVVKVGDFGLARDVYSSDYYRANQGARIPVKWMAPETLADTISNKKTDVWSFGVTCWEVFSLGRGPYPGIQNQDILKHISTDNNRLERPSLCPEPLYSILMSQCWRLLPEERPTFSQLVQQLQDYWEEECAYVIEDPSTPIYSIASLDS